MRKIPPEPLPAQGATKPDGFTPARKALAALNALPFASRVAIIASLGVGDEGLLFLPSGDICVVSRETEDHFTLQVLDGVRAATNVAMAWRHEEREAIGDVN